MGSNITKLAGKTPKSEYFTNYRSYCMYLGNEIVFIEENKALDYIHAEWQGLVKEHVENPCNCGEDHSELGLIAQLLSVYLFKCKYAVDIYGSSVEEVLQDPTDKAYRECIELLNSYEEKVGHVPSVEATQAFELFLHELCIQYGFDYFAIMDKAYSYYRAALKELYKQHILNI